MFFICCYNNLRTKLSKTMIDYVNTVQLAKLVDWAKNDSEYEAVFSLAKEKYHLGFGKQGPEDIFQTALRINERENDKGAEVTERKQFKKNKNQSWVFGELKVFCWVSVYYCHSKPVSLCNWGPSDFSYMQSIFTKKSIDFISYEAANLLYSKAKLRQDWTKEQINYLKDIINQSNDKNQWRYISFKIYCLSNHKYFRPLQQCRQKWMNYLNPKVRKGEWSLQEDFKLFTLIESVGCKWALISRQLKGERTQHMVKNRYNSYMKSWKIKCNIKNHLELGFKILSHLKNKLKREETPNNLKIEDEIHSQNMNAEEEKQQNSNENEYSFPVYKQQIISHFQCNQFIEKMISKVQDDCDKEDKRTKDEEDQQDMNYHFLISNIENNDIKQEQMHQIDDPVPILNEEVKNENGSMTVADVDKILMALGCHHYEQIIDDNWLDQLQERNNLQWIQ